MNTLIALFFAAGVAGFVYTKMGRRLGYSNTQNVWITVGVSFVISFVIFYSILAWFLHIH